MTTLKLFLTALIVCFAATAHAQKLGALVTTNAVAATDTIPVTIGTNTWKVSVANLLSAGTAATNSLTVFNAQAYGWLPDGTDRTAAATNLLQVVYNAGGGTIYFPPGSTNYRADGQLFIPNNGGSPSPNQPPIKLVGSGGGANWYNIASIDPSTLDLRYTGTNGAKIETRGRGTLWISGLTIKDGSATTNTTPLLHSSNTQLMIDHVTFSGAGGSGQDGIIFGGTNVVATNTLDGCFQGYGSVVSQCQFTRLNRGCYLLTHANSIVIRDNAWQGNTGTVGLEIDGRSGVPSGNASRANVISGNLFEMDVYQYGVILRGAHQNTFSDNSFWDAGAQVISYYQITNSSSQNVILGDVISLSPVVKPAVTGATVDMMYTTLISAMANRQDMNRKGIAASEFTDGVIVRGTYHSASNYPGQFTVADQSSNPNFNISIGFDPTTVSGIIEASNGGGVVEPIALNPKGGKVAIGRLATTANLNGILDVYGNITASTTITGTNGFSGMRSNLLAPTSLTFPATTVNWTNPLPVSIQVIIDNSVITGTAIKKNGTTISSQTVGTTTVGLQVGEYFSETYTVGNPSAVYFPYP